MIIHVRIYVLNDAHASNFEQREYRMYMYIPVKCAYIYIHVQHVHVYVQYM